jgi:iron complex transport system substrate-binding protein
VRSLIDAEQTSRTIHQAVSQALRQRQALYDVDVDLLQALQPDLIVTQDLCEVCALHADDVAAVLARLPNRPTILPLHPHAVKDVLEDIRAIGCATDRPAEADAFIAQLRARIARVRSAVAGAPAPRVVCLEWLDPLMRAGHWVPQMVGWAGGCEQLGRPGQPSTRITWEQVVEARPDVLVLMPCGLLITRIRQELGVLTSRAGWDQLPAVQRERVWLVNGPAYFNRSGPRLIDGIELLAALFHPERAGTRRPDGAAELL